MYIRRAVLTLALVPISVFSLSLASAATAATPRSMAAYESPGKLHTGHQTVDRWWLTGTLTSKTIAKTDGPFLANIAIESGNRANDFWPIVWGWAPNVNHRVCLYRPNRTRAKCWRGDTELLIGGPYFSFGLGVGPSGIPIRGKGWYLVTDTLWYHSVHGGLTAKYKTKL